MKGYLKNIFLKTGNIINYCDKKILKYSTKAHRFRQCFGILKGDSHETCHQNQYRITANRPVSNIFYSRLFQYSRNQ